MCLCEGGEDSGASELCLSEGGEGGGACELCLSEGGEGGGACEGCWSRTIMSSMRPREDWRRETASE